VKTKYSNFQKFRIQTFMISNSSWTKRTRAQVIMKIFSILYLLLQLLFSRNCLLLLSLCHTVITQEKNGELTY